MPLLLQIENGRKKARQGQVDRVNVEYLTSNKTLTANDAPVQIFTSDAQRTVYLPTSGLEVGQKFEIWNANAFDLYNRALSINTGGVNSLVDANCRKVFRWDGQKWLEEYGRNISIGTSTYGCKYGISIGYGAQYSDNGGISIGAFANVNYNNGIGIGYNAILNNNAGISIGNDTSSQGLGVGTIAIGAYTRANRNNEFVTTGSASISNKAQFSVCKFREKDLASNGEAWQELFLDASSARLVILAGSVVQFCLYLNAIRSDAIVKCWKVEGVIKRPSSGNVSIVGSVVKTVVAGDTGTTNWDCQITADTTNQALKVEVKHDSTTNVRFSGNCIITETRL